MNSIQELCLDLTGDQEVKKRTPMQGDTGVILVWEDSTWHGATKPMLLDPHSLEALLDDRRSPQNEKPSTTAREKPVLPATRGRPSLFTFLLT